MSDNVSLVIRKVKINLDKKYHISVFFSTETMKSFQDKIKNILSIKNEQLRKEKIVSFFKFVYSFNTYKSIEKQIQELKNFIKSKQHPLARKIKPAHKNRWKASNKKYYKKAKRA